MHVFMMKIVSLLKTMVPFLLLVSFVGATWELPKITDTIHEYTVRNTRSMMPAREDIRAEILRQLRSIENEGKIPLNQTIKLREIDVRQLYDPIRQKERRHAIKRDDAQEPGPAGMFVNMEDLPPSIPCIPRTHLLRLTDLTGYKDLTFHPPCMFVSRCDGCCGYKECVATKFERKTFVYTHREHGNMSEQHFDVDYHQACKYQCHEKRSECSEAQVFNAEKCKCECPYIVDCDWAHSFNEHTCKCECIETWPCKRTWRFSKVDCKCHRRYFYNDKGVRIRDDSIPRYNLWDPDFEVPPPDLLETEEKGDTD